MSILKSTLSRAAIFAASLLFLPSIGAAALVQVTVTNLATVPGGIHFTPVFAGFHDGSYDTFDPGGMANPGLEALAEDGNNGPLLSNFLATSGRVGANIIGVSGLGPGIFTPGRVSSMTFNVDPASNRYFSYASMLLPSNDAFLGNANPLAREIFDGSGNFLGADFTITGAMIWDAGTEANDTLGAPFSMIGGMSTPTAEPIAFHPGLDNFIGSTLGNGQTFTSAFTGSTSIARIQVTLVPEPGVASLGLLGGLTLLRRRRK
jgi:hypothetical protein